MEHDGGNDQRAHSGWAHSAEPSETTAGASRLTGRGGGRGGYHKGGYYFEGVEPDWNGLNRRSRPTEDTNGVSRSKGFVLFCFVWLATLGMPVVAPGTAAGPFRRVVEAPFWVPSSPVVERGALSTEVPPHLKRGEVPGHCRPGHPRSSFGGARAHSPCERTQR